MNDTDPSAGPGADHATTAPITLPGFETLVVTVDGPRGSIELNRPESLNALSLTTLAELERAARALDEHHDLKVVVVSGRGRAFSAGADMESFRGPASREDRDLGWRMGRALEEMRAVTVAKVAGWCVGGGVVVVAACDLRVAAEDARFSIPEVDLGIPLAWGGIPRLVREIGPALTKELVMTCRPFAAAEAKQIGFLNRVVPGDRLDAEVEELVGQLLDKARFALLATKAHTNAVTEAMVNTGRSWTDAESLAAAFLDDEGAAARTRYLERLRARRRSG